MTSLKITLKILLISINPDINMNVIMPMLTPGCLLWPPLFKNKKCWMWVAVMEFYFIKSPKNF